MGVPWGTSKSSIFVGDFPVETCRNHSAVRGYPGIPIYGNPHMDPYARYMLHVATSNVAGSRGPLMKCLAVGESTGRLGSREHSSAWAGCEKLSLGAGKSR
jgi:hypothetical protein